MILRIGIKELSKTAKPHVLYAGHDGNAAAQVIAALKPGEYVRVFKVDHPQLIPLALPTVLAEQVEPVAPRPVSAASSGATEENESAKHAKSKPKKV
jgi:hypothetical protein